MPSPNRLYKVDPLWHVQIFLVVAFILQIFLPNSYVAGPRYALLVLEVILFLALIATTPKAPVYSSVARRTTAIILAALVSAGNIYSLLKVAQDLLAGGQISNGHQLIIASLNIYVTNIIIFGLWYWELDGGGPGRRRELKHHEHDFLFPQMVSPDFAERGWTPTFFDYLYISVTNATAFSPTDTLPLSRRAKLLMSVQAVVSLITIALVAARAVNILS